LTSTVTAHSVSRFGNDYRPESETRERGDRRRHRHRTEFSPAFRAPLRTWRNRRGSRCDSPTAARRVARRGRVGRVLSATGRAGGTTGRCLSGTFAIEDVRRSQHLVASVTARCRCGELEVALSVQRDEGLAPQATALVYDAARVGGLVSGRRRVPLTVPAPTSPLLPPRHFERVLYARSRSVNPQIWESAPRRELIMEGRCYLRG
jgi:hypothetical protein